MLSMSKYLSIIGVGGHGKVVTETAILDGFTIDKFFDDDHQKLNLDLGNNKVTVPIDFEYHGSLFIAIGNNKIRRLISHRFINQNWETIIHPSVILSHDVIIGEGSVVMAGVIIQAGTRIGKHCIINTGACIDHDCKIGDYVHIAPNSSLAGGVSIGEGTFIGIGSTIIPNKVIGSWTNIGAGSVVIIDQPNNCTSVGIPAKPIKFNNEK